MRHNVKRSSRNRGPNGNNNGNNKKNARTRVYESNGPETKIRGTAYQVTEKYELLAKDAETSGNTVLAENYRQHAEHYQRVINSFEAEAAAAAAAQKEEETSIDVSSAPINAQQSQSEMAMA